MKSALQQYEANTKQLMRISLTLLAIGIFVYVMWSGIGIMIAAIGAVGLVWCYMRR